MTAPSTTAVRVLVAVCIGLQVLTLGTRLMLAEWALALAHASAVLGFSGWLIALRTQPKETRP